MARKPLTYEELCTLPLLQQAAQQEEARHLARMAEIQKMAKALNALELERAEIQRNGFRLFGDSLRHDFAKSALVYSGCMGIGDEIRLATALLRSGWKIADRDDGLYPSPTFRKGRVNLKASCWHKDTLAEAERRVAAQTMEAASQK